MCNINGLTTKFYYTSIKKRRNFEKIVVFSNFSAAFARIAREWLLRSRRTIHRPYLLRFQRNKTFGERRRCEQPC